MMPQASQTPTWLAIGGGAGIALVAGSLLNSEVLGGLPLLLGVPVAFDFLGSAIGKKSGSKATPLALLAAFVGAVVAFVVQAGVIAVGVSRNPTSHNLWPFELVMIPAEMFFFSLPVFIGSAIGARSGQAKPQLSSEPLD